MATQAHVSRSSSVVAMRPVAPVRRVFTSRLAAVGTLPAALTPSVGGSQAHGTVRIVVNDDDTFEYLATIYNPGGEAFTGAVLRRGGQAGPSDVLATLFSDVTLRSRYIQLRGTISISRGASPGSLAEELRERPNAFSICVLSASAPRGVAILGTVE